MKIKVRNKEEFLKYKELKEKEKALNLDLSFINHSKEFLKKENISILGKGELKLTKEFLEGIVNNEEFISLQKEILKKEIEISKINLIKSYIKARIANALTLEKTINMLPNTWLNQTSIEEENWPFYFKILKSGNIRIDSLKLIYDLEDSKEWFKHEKSLHLNSSSSLSKIIEDLPKEILKAKVLYHQEYSGRTDYVVCYSEQNNNISIFS